jgi:hypothetical protein
MKEKHENIKNKNKNKKRNINFNFNLNFSPEANFHFGGGGSSSFFYGFWPDQAFEIGFFNGSGSLILNILKFLFGILGYFLKAFFWLLQMSFEISIPLIIIDIEVPLFFIIVGTLVGWFYIPAMIAYLWVQYFWWIIIGLAILIIGFFSIF